MIYNNDDNNRDSLEHGNRKGVLDFNMDLWLQKWSLRQFIEICMSIYIHILYAYLYT